MKKDNESPGLLSQVTDFFASVKLALVILIVLAVTSVIGTVIPQGEPAMTYIRRYGQGTWKLIGFFQLQDMYHSWWFLWLLLIFSVNLIVCSLKRFSTTWKVISAPPRAVNERLFETLPFHKKFRFTTELPAARQQVQAALGSKFKRLQEMPASGGGLALYAEKGRYTRLGVYLVHCSILIILAGGIVGSLWGFKGFLELKEGETKDRLLLRDTGELRPLGFSVRCDRFSVSFYENGMPKEYRSDLTFLEKGREPQKAAIRVNDPFTFQGITFYQSSWDQSLGSATVVLTAGGQTHEVTLTEEQRPQPVPGTPYSLILMRYVNNLAEMGPGLGLILSQGDREVDHGWTLVNHPGWHGNRLGDFKVTVKGVKTTLVTGMQVNRDPGIWFIWVGSILMLLGFLIAFYFSHQQVWVWFREKTDGKGKIRIEADLGATAHKNRSGFIFRLERLVTKLGSNA
jgi:cytochrome c biogenesis protein